MGRITKRSAIPAAAAYILCALRRGDLVSASGGGGAMPSSSSSSSAAAAAGAARWRRAPPFVTAKAAPVARDAPLRIRGGGSDDDGGATAVIEAEVLPPADAADDGDAVVVEDGADAADAAADGDAGPPPRNLTFGPTRPHDGSAEDPDGLPSRFLNMKKGDRAEAREAFGVHLGWRDELGVDDILARPHPKFDVCKAMAPHYIAGRDPHGNVIFVQRPALLDFEMMRKNNATIDDLLLHYVYVIEYCWNICEPGPPEGVMTNVLDMRGLSFRQMKNQEYIGFGKRFVSMMSLNYPGRSYKTLIINAPKWFHALFKVFKPLLRESTRQKIVIMKAGEEQDSALKFYLGDSLPDDLVSGGQKGTWEKPKPGTRYFLPIEDAELCQPGPNSLTEYEMRQFCIEQLKFHNQTIQEVI